jgi:hypothetical protein
MRVSWVVAGLLIAGCGSESAGTPSAAREHGDAAASKPKGAEHSDAGTSKPTQNDSGTVGSSDEATLVMQPFNVDPGSEVFVCQSFLNPFGETALIREFESHMSAGSHHLIVNYEEAAPSGLDIQPCSGLIPPTGPFATQVPDDKYTYQEGIAAPLDAKNVIQIVSHYLNTGSQTISPTVTVTLRRLPGGSIVRAATMLTMAYLNIDIPAHQTVTISTYGGLSENAEMLWLLPHMHSRGRHFQVTLGETNPVTIFETNDWESAPHRFDPPQPLRADERVNYSCTWVNDTSDTLTFGESAAKNEMCLLAFQYVLDE